jgi:hypothetical protein
MAATGDDLDSEADTVESGCSSVASDDSETDIVDRIGFHIQLLMTLVPAMEQAYVQASKESHSKQSSRSMSAFWNTSESKFDNEWIIQYIQKLQSLLSASRRERLRAGRQILRRTLPGFRHVQQRGGKKTWITFFIPYLMCRQIMRTSRSWMKF